MGGGWIFSLSTIDKFRKLMAPSPSASTLFIGRFHKRAGTSVLLAWERCTLFVLGAPQKTTPGRRCWCVLTLAIASTRHFIELACTLWLHVNLRSHDQVLPHCLVSDITFLRGISGLIEQERLRTTTGSHSFSGACRCSSICFII